MLSTDFGHNVNKLNNFTKKAKFRNSQTFKSESGFTGHNTMDSTKKIQLTRFKKIFYDLAVFSFYENSKLKKSFNNGSNSSSLFKNPKKHKSKHEAPT